MKRIESSRPLVSFGLAFVLAGSALAHGDERGRPAAGAGMPVAQEAFGTAGDPTKVSRTIDVGMTDEMRFVPAVVDVKVGETLRFRLTNKGKTNHEMVIGTLRELQEHAALMKRFPEMEHSEPYMVHVRPGATEEIVWKFNRLGEFSYACLVAGHFEAGMVGKAIVRSRT